MVWWNRTGAALLLLACCRAADGTPGMQSEAARRAAARIVPLLRQYATGFEWPGRLAGGPLDDTGMGGYVAWQLGGPRPAFPLPGEAAGTLREAAAAVESALAAGTSIVDTAARRADLAGLALLARYHARRIEAAASLALFNATGDVSALRAAMSDAAAGVELWERLVRAVDPPAILFGPAESDACRREAAVVRDNLARLEDANETLRWFGLFDLGFDFGPEGSRAGDGRFRLLHPRAPYWRGAPDVRGSEPEAGRRLFGGYLRGGGSATLEAPLPDGEYRITCVVVNRPEVAAGSFEVRAGANAISYAAGETGEKSMDTTVSGGKIEIRFVPGSGGDWLMSGLLITRRAPHIGWVPVRSPDTSTPLFVSPTITAPDGIREASFQCDGGPGEPLSVPLRPEGLQFTGRVDWPKSWARARPRCRVLAVDSRAQRRNSLHLRDAQSTIGVMTDTALPRCEFNLDRLQLRLDVTLPAQLSAITPVVDRTLETVREMGCAREDETDVETALREALANAIVHGCRRDPAKSVQVTVMCEESRGILVIVRDPGPGFSPDLLPSPVVGQNLYSSHGRGIYMITRFMDEVYFDRGGTAIYMRKRPGNVIPGGGT